MYAGKLYTTATPMASGNGNISPALIWQTARSIRDLRLYLLNPTGLTKVNALELLEADLKINDIDVCMICESRFTMSMRFSDVLIDGFDLFRRDHCDQRNCGGVCIYVKNTSSSCNVDLDVSFVTNAE